MWLRQYEDYKYQAFIQSMTFRADRIIEAMAEKQEATISTDISEKEMNEVIVRCNEVIDSYYNQCRNEKEKCALDKIIEIQKDYKRRLLDIARYTN